MTKMARIAAYLRSLRSRLSRSSVSDPTNLTTEEGKLKNRASTNSRRARWYARAIVGGLLFEVIILLAYSAEKSWHETALLIASALVIAMGVWGEDHHAHEADSANAELQRISEEHVAAAETRAAQSMALAADSQSRSGRARREAAQANERAKQLEKDAESARASIAEANARAAEATERAAKADLARVQFEAQLSPRMLDQSQWDLIQSFRGKFSAINIAFETDAESWWFANELKKAFMQLGIIGGMFSRDPSVHSFSVMIFEPNGFDGARARTVGPLVELFKDQQVYGSAAIIGGLPTDILKHAGEDEEARLFLQQTPMIIVGGRFIIPPAHWPKPPKQT